MSQSAAANWARDRRWARWFALPVALGFVFVAVLSRLPAHIQIVMTMWFMTSHYFVDGNIWRRKFYPLIGRFSSGRVAEPEPTGGVPVGVRS